MTSEIDIKVNVEDYREEIVNTAAHILVDKVERHFKPNTYFAKAVEEAVQKHLNPIMEPIIVNGIKDLVLKKTNEYGEEKGESVTFTEYMVARVERWLVEDIDYDGKTKAQKQNYGSWSKAGQRLPYMIDRHLQYTVERACAEALKIISEQLEPSIKDLIGTQMKGVIDKIKMPKI